MKIKLLIVLLIGLSPSVWADDRARAGRVAQSTNQAPPTPCERAYFPTYYWTTGLIPSDTPVPGGVDLPFSRLGPRLREHFNHLRNHNKRDPGGRKLEVPYSQLEQKASMEKAAEEARAAYCGCRNDKKYSERAKQAAEEMKSVLIEFGLTLDLTKCEAQTS